MAYNLFLDDERSPKDVTWVQIASNKFFELPVVICKNYEEFVKQILSFGLPASVSFDHDLADAHYVAMMQEVEAFNQHGYSSFVDDEHGGLNLTFDYGAERTGYDCAKWLVDFCIERELKFPPYSVHSMNPIGAKRIRDYIEWAKGKMNI